VSGLVDNPSIRRQEVVAAFMCGDGGIGRWPQMQKVRLDWVRNLVTIMSWFFKRIDAHMALSGPPLLPSGARRARHPIWWSLVHGLWRRWPGSDRFLGAPLAKPAADRPPFAAPNAPMPHSRRGPAINGFPISRIDPHEMQKRRRGGGSGC